MRILVLGGGTSNEREVSLRSMMAVSAASVASGHTVTEYDPALGEAHIIELAKSVDVVFPILHGAGGEDGEIQALLERTGVPYLGSGVTASQLAFDKVTLKELLLRYDIATPNYAVVSAQTVADSPLIHRPFVLKPILGGSSIDLLIERHKLGSKPHYNQFFKNHHEMLLEELIEGIELTVPVLDGAALPVIEIIPPAGQEFDYTNKYNGQTQELCPAMNVSAVLQLEAQRLAETVHRISGARHLSRTDMIVRPDGSIVVLELNTMPGMTNQSLYPKSALVSGMDMPTLMNKFIELALR